MKANFISDVHISNDQNHLNMVCSFLDSLDKNSTLVINGDFFDFHKLSGIGVYRAFFEILPILSKFKMVVYIIGNHDWSLKEITGKYKNIKISYPSIIINDIKFKKKIYVTHGHIQSKFYWFLKRTKFLEKVPLYPIVYSWFVKNRMVAKLVAKFLSSRDDHTMRSKYKGFLEDLKASSGFTDIVVGHSHIPCENEDGYHNIGDFVKSFTYLSYNDGVFSLEEYKNGE